MVDFLLIFLAVLVAAAAMMPGVWWCLRLHYRMRGRGYSSGSSVALVVGLGVGLLFVVLLLFALAFGVGIMASTAFPLLLVPAWYLSLLVVTAVAALMPRRQDQRGFSGFLTSRVSRFVEASRRSSSVPRRRCSATTVGPAPAAGSSL